jgi:hypothetical protein
MPSTGAAAYICHWGNDSQMIRKRHLADVLAWAAHEGRRIPDTLVWTEIVPGSSVARPRPALESLLTIALSGQSPFDMVFAASRRRLAPTFLQFLILRARLSSNGVGVCCIGERADGSDAAERDLRWALLDSIRRST